MKKLFYFLIPILTFFSIQTVYASTGSIEFNKQFNNTSSETSFSFKNQFTNWGMSHVYFSVALRSTDASPDKLTSILSVTIDNGGQGEALCTTDNYYSYKDSTSQYLVLNYDCHMNLSSNGLGRITFQFAPATTYNSTVYTTSYLIYVVQDSDNTSSLVDAINNNNASSSVNSLNNAMQTKLTEQMQNDDKNAEEIKKEQKATTDAIKSLNDSINNSDTSGSQSELENVNDKFKDDISKSPISDLINLPLKLLTAFNNKLSSNQVCTPYDMGTIFGVHWLQLPCINPPDYLGSVLWATIDMITTALLLWSIAHKMVKVYISISTVDGQFVTKIVSQTGGML